MLFSVSIALFIFKIWFVVCSVARSVKLLLPTYFFSVNILVHLWILNAEVFLKLPFQNYSHEPWGEYRIWLGYYWTLQMKRWAIERWMSVKFTKKLFFSKRIECYDEKYLRYIIHIWMERSEPNSSNTRTIKNSCWTCLFEYYYRIICSIFLLFLFYFCFSCFLFKIISYEVIQSNQGLISDNVNVFHTDIFQFT